MVQLRTDLLIQRIRIQDPIQLTQDRVALRRLGRHLVCRERVSFHGSHSFSLTRSDSTTEHARRKGPLKGLKMAELRTVTFSGRPLASGAASLPPFRNGYSY